MTNWFMTGVSSGLGEALSQAALARGDTVTGTMRKIADKEAFEKQAPDRARGVLLDLSMPEIARSTVMDALPEIGEIDILVNNAGFGLTGAIEETPLDQIRHLFEVNLMGPIAMIQAILPQMRQRRAGHIVNITSMSGFAPWGGTGIYGASKYAMECIGQTLAQEVESFGITVTNVAPGGFRTGFAGSALAEANNPIEDYENSPVRQNRDILTQAGGKERGDPKRAAQAILNAVALPDPPKHLFLGEDALLHTREHLDLVEEEMDKWREWSLSTAFPKE
ncbi:SDR family NAD(P)-dependent oxidoreductase [Altericroceibacterium spongiae]|uniref:SDR family NAD(P)-dependent oxidoreductase n=1 Tax=Altericroceibacterium spongiae TaxID=2320269 RepID=A0A420ER29_9SPHN|nr:oxidoreductase [Altericroceibacterium spongiae]RKF23132.1 SDR family NAD(P)-dependent oxidoreductase [Altericroceibacterium spongiae]